MRASTLFRVVCVTLAAGVFRAEAAWIEYEIDVSEDRRTVAVSVAVTGLRTDALTMVLATPPIDAETYFRFFDEIRFTAADSTDLSFDRPAPGVYRLRDVPGVVRCSYRVHAGELSALAPVPVRVPFVDESGAVLPLRALLAVPVDAEGEGLPVSTVFVTVRDGERPLHVAWPTRDGRGAFELADAARIVRTAVAVTGAAEARDLSDEGAPAYVVVRGTSGEPADVAKAVERIAALVRDAVATMGTTGEAPITIVLDVRDGPHDVAGSGPFVNARCSGAYLHATPSELTFGSGAYDFHRSLAHEIYHRWVGTAGLVRPSDPEIFWLSEGAAEYWAILALVRAGLAEPRSALDALAEKARRLSAHPDRDRAIDGGERTYASSAAYREAMLLKAPLVCFLIDMHLLASEEPLSFDRAMRFVLIAALMRPDTAFARDHLADTLEKLLGPEGRTIASSHVKGPIEPALRARSEAVGLSWSERDGGPVFTLEAGSAFAPRLRGAK